MPVTLELALAGFRSNPTQEAGDEIAARVQAGRDLRTLKNLVRH